MVDVSNVIRFLKTIIGYGCINYNCNLVMMPQ